MDKDTLTQLVDQGFSTRQIGTKLDCSHTTVQNWLTKFGIRTQSPPKITPSQRAANRRRTVKEILIEEAGGKCLDCGYVGPPFLFDFDHRNPKEKQFQISQTHLALATLRDEAKKCDLVCANCHRMRTHKQRCSGCKYCFPM